jgi:hypothetical protein
VTKHEIYSTYSPRSSINFLAICSNFCKPLQRNSECFPSNQVLAAAMTSVSYEQWRPINCFLSSRNRMHVSGEPGHCCARTRPLWWPSVAFFLQNVLQLHQQIWVVVRVDSLVLWKIINEEDSVLIPKNCGKKFSSESLHSEFFGAGWAPMPPLHWLLLWARVIVI